MAKDQWFTWDSDEGFVTHATEQEARDHAEKLLADWRDFARYDGEWGDEMDGLCWGRIHAEVEFIIDVCPDAEKIQYTDYQFISLMGD